MNWHLFHKDGKLHREPRGVAIEIDEPLAVALAEPADGEDDVARQLDKEAEQLLAAGAWRLLTKAEPATREAVLASLLPDDSAFDAIRDRVGQLTMQAGSDDPETQRQAQVALRRILGRLEELRQAATRRSLDDLQKGAVSDAHAKAVERMREWERAAMNHDPEDDDKADDNLIAALQARKEARRAIHAKLGGEPIMNLEKADDATMELFYAKVAARQLEKGERFEIARAHVLGKDTPARDQDKVAARLREELRPMAKADVALPKTDTEQSVALLAKSQGISAGEYWKNHPDMVAAYRAEKGESPVGRRLR